ncbi:hypothetical protein [Ramlibacter sp. Leaf400]|uniref:hypothetical protein n=1 Tax=Ramlibacter sp. Leaf400 TaxID=1736365 RepID=UPI000700CEA7|nr:hypothetical protein [Ramlibacter sp. Leaf400]KQT11026.1 hypothetical protein ASG30_09555 [Ramlibacter sp. Leaf400]
MKLDSKLRMSLTKRPGNVVLRRDLSGLGSPSHLTEAINSLVAAGRLVRLGSGVYAKASPGAEGTVHLAAEPDVLAREVFEKLGIEVRVVDVGDEGGRRAYVLDTGRRRISRKLDFGDAAVAYPDRRHAPRTGGFTLPDDLDRLPRQGVRAFVERLAQAHGIQHHRTGVDDFAEAVTRASGDDVRLDRTGKLLVALKKNSVITGRQLARLMTNHMEEAQGVRPVRGLPDRRLSPQR